MSSIVEIENEIVEDFELFDDWSDKYEYIIELGQKLKGFPEEKKTDDLKIKGCQSSVWLIASLEDGKVIYQADSDSTLVKGLIALLIRVLSNQKPEDIVHAELGFVDRIGLSSHLAQTRANGLSSMIKQMKLYALAYQSKNH